MENFKSIQAWLATNPSEDSQKVILNAINRRVKAEKRIELYYKNQKLQKALRLLRDIPNLEALETLKKEVEEDKKSLRKLPRSVNVPLEFKK